jgi:hypothetical protein
MATRRRPQRKDRSSPADAMPADMRRTVLGETRPDDLPDVESGRLAEDVVDGGLTPKPDAGVGQHPIHDEDQKDAEPSDYERELDRLDAASRTER